MRVSIGMRCRSMLRKIPRPAALPLALASIFLIASAAVGQNRQFHIDYTVDVSNPETGRFRVTANVQNLNQPRLDLSLPVWTPGWYTIENYAKTISRSFRSCTIRASKLEARDPGAAD